MVQVVPCATGHVKKAAAKVSPLRRNPLGTSLMTSYWVGDGEGNSIEYDFETKQPVPPERSSLLTAYVRPMSDGIPDCYKMYELNGAIIKAEKKQYGSKQTAQAIKDLPVAFRVVHDSLIRKLNRLRENDAMALDLRNELVLYRAVLEDAQDGYGEALQMFEAVMYSDDPAITAENRRTAANILKLAGGEMLTVLKDVKDAVVDAARVEYMTDDKFSGRSVRELMYGAVRLLYEVCGEENAHIAEVFNQRIMQHVPSGGNVSGSSITPDMVDADVLAMDATVPVVIDAEAEKAESPA